MENKKKLFIIGGISLALILVLGITYAWLTQVLSGTKTNIIKAGSLNLVLDDNAANGINLEVAVPETDEVGLSHPAYTFTVENKGTMNAGYVLYLSDEEIDGTRLEDENIRYSLTKNGSSENPQDLTTTLKDGKRVLDNTIIDGGKTNSYTLKLWISGEAGRDIANKVFKAKIGIEAVQTEDSSEDMYKLTGTIKKNDEVVTNGVLVAFPDPKYGIVNASGETEIEGLENGIHHLYYVENVTLAELENKTQSEIASIAGVGKGTISIPYADDTINLTSNYTVEDVVVEKEETGQTTGGHNSHIKAVYAYNQSGTGTGLDYTGCLGGEEAGCEQIEKPEEYTTGTIIKYEVKPGVEKYFNVLYDNGDTLIMQERENTVYSKEWCNKEDYIAAGGTESEWGSGNNNKGPITALTALENATADWVYVNDQTYTMGTTQFGRSVSENHKTTTTCELVNYAIGCYWNFYTGFSRTNVKARMITGQELYDFNCTNKSTKCSSNFLNNYLYDSTKYNATVTDDSYYDISGYHNYGYWTMSAYASSMSSNRNRLIYYAIAVGSTNYVGYDYIYNFSFGARAVVVINK